MAIFAYYRYLLQSSRKHSVRIPLHPNLRQSHITGGGNIGYVDSCFELFSS